MCCKQFVFKLVKAKAEIWMRENNGLYEYIAVYVNGLLIKARDTGSITKDFNEKNKIKQKGVGPWTYHLRCD
jgi:hypothetical protein